jgi:uncharacterized NAD-dependent epimerase/dehydratase family protein
MRGVEHPLPSISEVIDATVTLGRLTNPEIRPLGIAVNTAALGEDAATQYLQATADEYGLPAVDPIRTGVGPLIDRLQGLFGPP